MKILVVTGIFPPDHGGPASYVPAICQALLDRGHTVVGVVTLREGKAPQATGYSFPIFPVIRQQNKLVRVIKVVSLIYRLSKKADIVYVNGLALESVLASKILSRKSMVIKVVGDLVWERAQNCHHDIDLESFQRTNMGIRYEFLKKLQAWYTSKADTIITPSYYLAKIVASWGISSQRIAVVHNGIIVAQQPQINYPAPDYDVIVVGRLIPLKKIDAVIRCCITNRWSLRIVGEGPERPLLESLVSKLNGKKFITFSGVVPQTEVITTIRSAKVFVLNSVHETFPHVILEAKEAGVPVVATKVGGIPEMVNNGVDGLLVPSGDQSALEQAINTFLTDECCREKVIEAGKKQIINQFSWKQVVNNTLALLIRQNKSI